MRTIIVTGTDTGVGKTIVTAAVATVAASAGREVAVVKPAQSGVGPGEESDVEVVSRLAGVYTQEIARYRAPLAPLTAARVSDRRALVLDDVVAAVRALDHDLVLIEGAGGLLVPMGEGGWTIADLAAEIDAAFLVVTRPDLGTLNHTALTLEALARRGREADVIIGAWPERPELVHETNLIDLPACVGRVRVGAGALSAEEFRQRARQWFTPAFLAKVSRVPR